MDIRCLPVLCIALLLWPLPSRAAAGGRPEGYGLAARYRGDRGIARDPAVIFAESFEEGGLAGVLRRWQEASNPEDKVLSLSQDVPVGSAGAHSLRMAVTSGQNRTGYLYRQFPRAVDAAFARYYVKYDSQHFAYHCGTHLGGYRPVTPYPQGDPGFPRGDDWMQVEVMPAGSYGSKTPPAWTVACFWPDMKVSADGGYYGNAVSPVHPAPLALDRWQCVEVMLKANTAPDSADGEMALWLDGKLVMAVKQGVPRGRWTGAGFTLAAREGEPFEGFRWRTSRGLKVNFLWLLYNVMEPNPATPVSQVWFDNVVVSTRYIGPLRP